MYMSDGISWRPGAYLINGRQTSAYEALCRLRDAGLDDAAALAELERLRVDTEAAGAEAAPVDATLVPTVGRSAEAIAADIRTRAARVAGDIVADPTLPAGSVEIVRVDPDLARWYATTQSREAVMVSVMLHSRDQVAAYAARWGVEATQQVTAGRVRMSALTRMYGVCVEALAHVAAEEVA